MHRITRAVPLPGHRVHVTFEDGTEGVVDLAGRLFGPVFEPLRDQAIFDRLFVDDFGAICWPNGADLAPDAIHATLKQPA